MLRSKFCYGLSVLIILQWLTGCGTMLPREKVITVGSWDEFKDVQQTFDNIIPYTTTVSKLNELKINPETNKNVRILNYSDITNRFISGLSIDGFTLDKGVRECILAKTNCKGYEINERVMSRKRYGNFWADILNFKRKTDIVGWEFNGIVLINNDLVIYKLSSGQPDIHEKVERKNPLGPLQSGSIATDRVKRKF